jgi:hypothetical protein
VTAQREAAARVFETWRSAKALPDRPATVAAFILDQRSLGLPALLAVMAALAHAPAEKLPPIARPRSWSKDDEDDWQALPRARQEKIAAREAVRSAEIRRMQNEYAKLKKEDNGSPQTATEPAASAA